ERSLSHARWPERLSAFGQLAHRDHRDFRARRVVLDPDDAQWHALVSRRHQDHWNRQPCGCHERLAIVARLFLENERPDFLLRTVSNPPAVLWDLPVSKKHGMSAASP